MSETYHLCCKTCKEHIWIGQGHSTTLYFYDGDKNTVSAFNIFLRRHLSTSPDWPEIYVDPEKPETHELVLLESQQVPEDWTEVSNVYKDDPVPDWGKWITYDLKEPLGEPKS